MPATSSSNKLAHRSIKPDPIEEPPTKRLKIRESLQGSAPMSPTPAAVTESPVIPTLTGWNALTGSWWRKPAIMALIPKTGLDNLAQAPAARFFPLDPRPVLVGTGRVITEPYEDLACRVMALARKHQMDGQTIHKSTWVQLTSNFGEQFPGLYITDSMSWAYHFRRKPQMALRVTLYYDSDIDSNLNTELERSGKHPAYGAPPAPGSAVVTLVRKRNAKYGGNYSSLKDTKHAIPSTEGQSSNRAAPPTVAPAPATLVGSSAFPGRPIVMAFSPTAEDLVCRMIAAQRVAYMDTSEASPKMIAKLQKQYGARFPLINQHTKGGWVSHLRPPRPNFERLNKLILKYAMDEIDLELLTKEEREAGITPAHIIEHFGRSGA